MRKKMTNDDVRDLMNDCYNRFFTKWRNNVPEITNVDAWIPIVDEGIKLIEKYQRFDDAYFQPCQTIIQVFVDILDDRRRGM